MSEPSGWAPPGWAGHDVPPGWGTPPPGPGWAPPPPPIAPAHAPPPVYGWGAPRPGIIPLRPLGLGEVFDGAFTTLRRYPRATLGITAVVVVVQQALTLGATLTTNDLPALPTQRGATFSTFSTFSSLHSLPAVVVALVNAALSAVLIGMITLVVGDAVLGRRVSAGDVWRRTRPLLWRLLGASVLAGVLPYLGLLLLIVPGVFLWGALALTTPALMLERTTVRGALRRSWRLAVPDWWRVFGYRLLAVLLSTIVASVAVIPLVIVTALMTANGNGTSLPTAALVVFSIASGLVSLLTEPFLAAVVALIYVDRRMRAEALDLTLTRAAGLAAPDGALVTRPPSYGSTYGA